MSATMSRKVSLQGSSSKVEPKTYLDLSEIDDRVWEKAQKIADENPQGLTDAEWLKKMFPD